MRKLHQAQLRSAHAPDRTPALRGNGIVSAYGCSPLGDFNGVEELRWPCNARVHGVSPLHKPVIAAVWAAIGPRPIDDSGKGFLNRHGRDRMDGFRKILVGVRGFEPPTPASRTQYSTRLSYTPNGTNTKGTLRVPLRSM